uniref:fatty acid 2-hydroxylase isoform X1 n=1 Tax=Myxine glutinosa TaxID=7769 RepID=UPI00359027ED
MSSVVSADGVTEAEPPRRYTATEIARHCTPDSCWVVHEGSVYDVTRFVRTHPGGESVLLRYAGTDVSSAMRGDPHRHSDNAYRWLSQYRIGHLESGSEPHGHCLDLQKENDAHKQDRLSQPEPKNMSSGDAELTYKTVSTKNDLVDWTRPLLWQVGHLGGKYNEWVHQPVDRDIRLFHSDLFESWTKTSWYVVPTVWVPIIFFWSVVCYKELAKGETQLFASFFPELAVVVRETWFPLLFIIGLFLWTLIEYGLHRFLFHMTPPASSYALITLHFLLHGQHHKSPFDRSRLVFPPLPASLFVGLFYLPLRAMLPSTIRGTVMVGGLLGYVVYDLMHYYLHYGAPCRGSYLYHLKVYHVKHHFEHQNLGFGITSKLWDYPFKTVIPEESFDKSK